MYALNLLSHFHLMSLAAESIGARAELQFDTMRLEVTGNGRYVELEPEFVEVRAGRTVASPTLESQSIAFTGWRYGPRKSWDLAEDKRAFKEFCARNDLRTPRAYGRPTDGTENVLIKQVRPSGPGGIIRGPFAPGAVPAAAFKADGGVFAEELILGDIALAMYCEGELYCVEARKKPRVIGDGRSTVRELIECGSQTLGEVDWDMARNVLRLQGTALENVLPEGKESLVDVRFWSSLQPFTTSDRNVLGQIAGTALHKQLVDAGPVFWRGIPESMRANVHFHVYAVVDAQQRAWFVDINTESYIDPHGYAPTLRKLFGLTAQTAATAAVTPPILVASAPQSIN